MELNYADLSNEIEKKLRKEKGVVLSTCVGNYVTARQMAHLNDGLTVMFSTSVNSLKVAQMRENPAIALTVDNLRMEAIAELYGHPDGHPTFRKEYAKKFPLYAKLYKSSPEDLLVICRPVKISLYKYVKGPCEDILVPDEMKAFRTGI